MGKKRRLMSVGSTPVKIRPREVTSPQSGEEVLSARDRFKGALQDLLPQPSDDESESSDDEMERHWTSSRAKRLSALRKKQIEVKLQEQRESGCRPFVMKLFDRSVDLAQFSESTPLYPICRAWMANQPHQSSLIKKEQKEETPTVGEDNSMDHSMDVVRLPPPESSVNGINKIRIPPPTPYQTNFTSMDHDGYDGPKKELLLRDNLEHWTKVRKSWLDASVKNEARYRNSFKVLLTMFNK